MNNKIYPILVCLLVTVTTFSQQVQKLVLDRKTCETIFLNENLNLLAERLEIPQAEALILQAKNWPNPNLTVDQVNFWASQSQLDAFDTEGLPPFKSGSDFGTKQQIGISLEQLIKTAGKRKKLIALEEVNLQKAEQYFEEVLRNLKYEFRNQLTNLQHLQATKIIYENELNSLKTLTQAYNRQLQLGNIPRGEYIRLKALELEIAAKINEINQDVNKAQQELGLLMRLPANSNLELTKEGFYRNHETLAVIPDLQNLIEQAYENRPDLKIAGLEKSFAEKQFSYEKAQRTPDVTFKVDYDRGGNFIYNFVGFGISVDLPVLDRNKGNIQRAALEIEQNQLFTEQKELSIAHEITTAYKDLNNSVAFFETIDTDYENSLDKMLSSYTQNFLDKNLSLLEYLDFMDAYLSNKTLILETGKQINRQAEELNYTLGLNLIN